MTGDISGDKGGYAPLRITHKPGLRVESSICQNRRKATSDNNTLSFIHHGIGNTFKAMGVPYLSSKEAVEIVQQGKFDDYIIHTWKILVDKTADMGDPNIDYFNHPKAVRAVSQLPEDLVNAMYERMLLLQRQ